MGQDYSYTQPSSSDEYDFAYGCLLQGEGEVETNAVPDQYAPQPECDDGVPKTCYCGAEPVVATAYTSKDPGRRYFTCVNTEDGECHIWKWLDVAVLEELSDIQRQVRMVKEQAFETDQKLMKIVKTLSESGKRKPCLTKGFVLCVSALGTLLGVVAAGWFGLHG